MGVDYDGVGGIGIELTGELREILIANGAFTKEEWDDDHYGCVESLGIEYSMAGDASYTGGEDTVYLFVKGDTLGDIDANEKEFRAKLSKYGINIERNQLKVIADLHVW